MELVESLNFALKHIEQHLLDETDSEKVAKCVGLSRFYLERTFAALTGMSVSEYIRARRLTLAAQELISGETKIIDLAFKYGYDTPESFTKAFSRFHGVTPTIARRMSTLLRCQNPLAISIKMEGVNVMNYKMEQMDAFKVVGVEQRFQMDTSLQEVPKFWDSFFKQGLHTKVTPMFGISFDVDKDGMFPYMIGEVLKPGMKVPEGMVVRELPALLWARFACTGPMPGAMQSLTKEIYSEWLPTNGTYEVAEYVEIEMYTEGDVTSKDYYSEVWLPVKKKA